MKAALNKSAKDAQIRDSFNKESFSVICDAAIYSATEILYTLQSNTPRNADRKHVVLVSGPTSGSPLYLIGFEILKEADVPFRQVSLDTIGNKKTIAKVSKLNVVVNETKEEEENSENDN